MDLLIASITLPFVFVFAACIGSFLNVVIYRLPEGISLIHPPSRCHHFVLYSGNINLPLQPSVIGC